MWRAIPYKRKGCQRMRTESNISPKKFSVEKLPSGKVRVHLYDNIELIDKDGEASYQYDEYSIEVFDRPGIEASVEKNFAEWIAKASGKENIKSAPTIEDRLTAVELENKKLIEENALLKTKVATIEATPTLKTELTAIKEPIISEPIIKK